jgi:histidyl-tRNA synthetase
MSLFRPLPGFREFYPEALARRDYLFRLWRQTAVTFGFVEYDAPALEPLELYKAKSGEEIEQQLFSFADKGGREVALRPEMTPTVCRMVGAKAGSLKRPIKWFSIAEFYRYERAQRGRERAFFQLNADIFGEASVEADLELIALLVQCLTAFGLTEQDFQVRLSDRDLWCYYLEALGIEEARVGALLVAIDKHERLGEGAFKRYADQFGALDAALQEKILAFLQVKGLPQIEAVLKPFSDGKLNARIADWRRLIDGLAAMNLTRYVAVDLGVVRGLAYYTGFVFEAFDRKGDLRALAGGGRYNDLIKKLGGPDLPAVGFAIGDVTMGLLLEQRGLMPAFINVPDVCVAYDGEKGRLAAYPDIQALRAAGVRVEYPLKELAFGKQLKGALESGAKLALIYGGDELARGVVKLRDLTERREREVRRELVPDAVRDFLTGS